MSRASEMFWSVVGHGLIMPGDQRAFAVLQEAASIWREAQQYCKAGLAMCDAIQGAWGNGAQVDACAAQARKDFEACVRTASPTSPEILLALSQLALGSHRLSLERRTVVHYRSEFAQHLLRYYAVSPAAEGYLVRGVILKSDLDHDWEVAFPRKAGAGLSRWNNNTLEIHVPSAFEVFIWLTDYSGANVVLQHCPQAFTTPGLRGWQAAVHGFLRPHEAADHFRQAAAAFAEDRMPSEEELLETGQWSSINTDLWAHYFSARAAVAQIPHCADRVAELIREAAVAVDTTTMGWGHGGTRRFRILVKMLARLLGQEPGLSPAEAREELLREARFSGEDDSDEVSLRFFHLVGEAFEGFKTDPAKAMVDGHLPSAIETLARIPLIGPDISTSIAPQIGAQALREAHGPDRTWVHRTLEGITDERYLRHILMRLLQASPSAPAYGQIRHGPLEYGTDIAVVLEDGPHRLLRMYQVKCGNITIPVWRQVRSQLEEMFLTDISTFQLHDPIHRREGVLVCNSHAQPQVEPLMAGWFEQEMRDHNHAYHFMHLDDVVNWIFDQRLFSSFRAVCTELGLPLS